MRMKFIYAACLLIAVAMFNTGCEKDPDIRIVTYPAPQPSGMSPNTGFPTTNVTITGSDFGVLPQAVKVWFGGIQATSVVSCTDEQIVVAVPLSAVSGKVSLQVWTNKVDSIGSYTVQTLPVIDTLLTSSQFGTNIALPGDTLMFSGSGFGTDASKLSVVMNGGATAKILSPVKDTLVKAIAPATFSSGYVNLVIDGVLTLTAPTIIINPNSPGDITPYFLGNTGDTTKGGGFTYSNYDGNRWGTLGAPWITNSAGLNKSGNTIGGWGSEPWNGNPGYICWETWGNTPVKNGIIYQPTAMALPAGSYTISFQYYTEIQQGSTVHLEVAAGKDGIPVLADSASALARVQLASPAVPGTTSPNLTEIKTLDFSLSASQYVSIGFLGNLTWGNGGDPGNYVLVKWIKLVKH